MCIFCNLSPCKRHLPLSFPSWAASGAWSQHATMVGPSASFRQERGFSFPSAASSAALGDRPSQQPVQKPVLTVPEPFPWLPEQLGDLDQVLSIFMFVKPHSHQTRKDLCLSQQDAPPARRGTGHAGCFGAGRPHP